MFYITTPNKLLVSLNTKLQANKDWIIETKNEKEDKLCESYKLKNLKELCEKYLQAEKPKGIKTNKKK